MEGWCLGGVRPRSTTQHALLSPLCPEQSSNSLGTPELRPVGVMLAQGRSNHLTSRVVTGCRFKKKKIIKHAILLVAHLFLQNYPIFFGAPSLLSRQPHCCTLWCSWGCRGIFTPLGGWGKGTDPDTMQSYLPYGQWSKWTFYGQISVKF